MRNLIMSAGLCLFLWPWDSALALTEPQSVPKLTERQLDKVSHVELARQWRASIEEHGESVDALVNLATAYYYGGEKGAAGVQELGTTVAVSDVL